NKAIRETKKYLLKLEEIKKVI
ncbi:MAG: hypothetical protein RIT33_511, partial [Pseudomonadota bacterium]